MLMARVVVKNKAGTNNVMVIAQKRPTRPNASGLWMWTVTSCISTARHIGHCGLRIARGRVRPSECRHFFNENRSFIFAHAFQDSTFSQVSAWL